MPIVLEITGPDGQTRRETAASGDLILGSGPSVGLRLQDDSISSIHAVIKFTDGQARVEDLGSEKGTEINGNFVGEMVSLAVGDELRLGNTRLKIVQLGENQGEDAPSPKGSDVKSAPVAQNEQRTPVSKLHHTEPVPGSNIVTDSSAILNPMLETELAEKNRPTNDERVLEVSVLWGESVLDSVQVGESRAITIGNRRTKSGYSFFTKDTKQYDLEVDGELPFGDNTIASNAGNSATIVVPSGAMVGVRKADGSIDRNVNASGSYNLALGDRVVFKKGTLTYMAHFVRGNAAMGAVGVMDWYFPRVFTISALAHGFFVLASMLTPELNHSLVDDLFKNQNRFAQMILKAPEEQKKRKKLDLSGAKGAKHKDEEGKFGKKDKPKKDKLASKAGAPRVDPNKREKDRKIAMNAGLLGMLKGGNSAVSNVFGPGGLGSGINNAMGGLRGTEMGDAGGAGGLGTRGTGGGGGGNSLGIGGLGTHGHGRGSGGYGNIDLGGRGKGRTRIVPGRTIIKGSLSKAEIGRVIRRNLARFKYCYEKQLNANPNLSGKISVYFTIAPTGSVPKASIRETSMNSKKVEKCVVKVMKSLKFPKPRGGGIVVVTYPFVFAST